MAPQAPQHVKWMALGMLRGLRSQLPIIAKDPMRQQWIAPWIANQLKVESKVVRTWLSLYDKKGGDATAVKGDPRELADETEALDVPGVPMPVHAATLKSSTTALSPGTLESVTVSEPPSTLPLALPDKGDLGDDGFFAPALAEQPKEPAVWLPNKATRNRTTKLKAAERGPEIRWQAVGMMRALEKQLPLLAQMHGFDQEIAAELSVHPKTVKDWWSEYRITGTVDRETVPPIDEDGPKTLMARIKGSNRYDTDLFRTKQKKVVAEEAARLDRRKKVRSCVRRWLMTGNG